MRLNALFVTAAFLVTACATPTAQTASAGPQSASNDCFRNQDVNGWRLIDPHTVRVDVSPSHSYALTTMGNVRDLNFANTIAIRARGSDWICTGRLNDVQIFVGGQIPRNWVVTGVARLPPDHPPPPPQGS